MTDEEDLTCDYCEHWVHPNVVLQYLEQGTDDPIHNLHPSCAVIVGQISAEEFYDTFARDRETLPKEWS